MPRSLLLSFPLLLAACDSRDAPAPPVMIPDPAQVSSELAEVPPAPAVDRSRWLGDGDWTLEPVASFAARMNDTVLVQTINALRPGPDGLLYVIMQHQASISVLNPDGTLVRRIGRRGGGPGEFEELNGHGWRNDSLWVTDATLGRLSWFDMIGNFLGSQPREQRGVQPTTIGTFIGLPPGDWNATEGNLLLLSAPDGEPRILHRSRWSRGGFRIPQGAGFVVGGHPQADEPRYARHPGGLGMAVVEQPPDGGKVRITWYAPDGMRRYAVVHELPTAPITASDWESFLDRQYNSSSAPPIPIHELLRVIPRPHSWIPVSRAQFARDGRLLLRGPEAGTDRAPWTLISPDGRLLGTTTLPADLRVMYVSADTLWGVRPNEDDLDVVTRYRMRW